MLYSNQRPTRCVNSRGHGTERSKLPMQSKSITIPLCACGCGNPVGKRVGGRRPGYNRFIHTHNKRRRPLLERFWESVEKTETCWLWSRATTHGYGAIGEGFHNGKVLLAHRVSWELHFGPIPNGMFVCHHCDNPLCVRPDHLFLGTQADNIGDAKKKGRMAVGANRNSYKSPRTKLSPDKVRWIKMERASGVPLTLLGRHLGVGTTTIWQVVQGKTWKWVT